MSTRTRVWLVAVTVVVFAMGVGGASAGQRAPAGGAGRLDQAAIQRSLAVQAELARIEANKEAYVVEMLDRWAPYVAPEVDLWGQVKSVAMSATPWRLLGASLTTDFDSGFRVLRGVVGPGWYVSAYIEGREPVIGAGAAQAQAGVADQVADALGSSSNSLVFTPIPPCRIVDTRGAGARTGMITGGTARAFDFTTGGFSKGQGGETSCPGLPSVNPSAWAVNITVVGHAASGYLTVYPFGHTMPATSFLNYFASAWSLANAGTVTGCPGCADSVWIDAYATTHVIVDVMGYYEPATGFATGATSQMWGAATVLTPGASDWQWGGSCPAGTLVVGGGAANNGGGGVLTSDHTITSGRWWEMARNVSSATYNFTVFSSCMDVR